MISPLYLWKKCLGLLCIAIWAFPLIAMTIVDEEAAKENLDTIYIGTIVTTINSTSKPTSCISSLLEFGPFSSRLTLGPPHNNGYDPNPFFLSLVGGERDKFIGSVQSSLTSKQDNKTWWTVRAEQYAGIGKGPYKIWGTMISDVGDVGQERNQLNGAWEVGKSKKSQIRRDGKFQHLERAKDDGDKKEDLCVKGRKQVFKWRHKKNSTTLTASVEPNEARIEVIGKVVLTLGSTSPEDEKADDLEEADGLEEEDDFEEEDTEEEEAESKDKENRLRRRQKVESQDITYTLVFKGKYHSDSAPLPTQGLAWEKAGSGPPMKPFEFFSITVKQETSSTSSKTTTTKPTSKTKFTTSMSTTMTKPTEPTTNSINTPGFSGPAETPVTEDEPQGPLPKGAVVGIVVGGVLAMVVFAVMIFLLKKWRARRKEPKVYPELAYIYSTPFTSTNKRTGGGGMSVGGASSAYAAGSRGTTAHSRNDQEGVEQGMYFGPPAPQLEVDLGDRAPFLDRNDRMGSPGHGVAAGHEGPGLRGFGSPEQQQAVGGVDYGGHSRLQQGPDDLEHEMRQPMLSPGATYYDQYRSHGHHMGREF